MPFNLQNYIIRKDFDTEKWLHVLNAQNANVSISLVWFGSSWKDPRDFIRNKNVDDHELPWIPV